MVHHFRNGEAKWGSFDASSPEVVSVEGGGGSRIEEAEVSESDEGKLCTT
jgi:hypothetical protein